MTKYKSEYILDTYTGKTVCVPEVLQSIDGMIKAGRSDGALIYIDNLVIIALENEDERLLKECNRRKNKIRFPYKCLPYDKDGAADPINQRKNEKKPIVAEGEHKGFPVIINGDDSYRMAQVFDLYAAMLKANCILNQKHKPTDFKFFSKCFTKGKTSSVIVWKGSKRQLHYIVHEWKHKNYITFEKDDDYWDIASKIFVNPKEKVNGRYTIFDADDLRKTKNPVTITQELEDFVEILNPENPSPNYEKFKKNAEDRIKYGQRMRENKKSEQKPNASQWDIYAHIWDDADEDENY